MTLIVGFILAAVAVALGLLLAHLTRKMLHHKTCARHATRSLDDDLKGAAHA